MSVSPPDDEALAIALQQEEDASSHTCCSFSMHAKTSNSEEAVAKILQELEDAKIARALQRQLSLERKVGITRTYPTPLPPAPSRIQQTVSHVPPRPRPTSTATTLPQKISSTHNQDIAPSTIASQKSKRQQQIEDMRAAEELQARVYLEDLQKRERLRTTQQPAVPHRRRILHSHRTRQPVISERASYEELLALDDTIVRHGVPEQVQQTLPTFSATEPAGSCAVCQEDYVQGEELLTLPCAHVYHKQCITTWMNTSKLCPICKYSISS